MQNALTKSRAMKTAVYFTNTMEHWGKIYV